MQIRNLLFTLLLLCFYSTGWASDTSTFQCDDGQKIELAFPNADYALMNYNGELILLKNVVAASGARYTGEGWQLWGKGQEEMTLAILKQGEDFASDNGRTCVRLKPTP